MIIINSMMTWMDETLNMESVQTKMVSDELWSNHKHMLNIDIGIEKELPLLDVKVCWHTK